ncbi:MAG: biotin transport system substrate-specific component [Microbacteriaceae bacterium]|jgi:biotin transport system substrate-specific component|nr:biotin transporter BioY [Microbacteriaceae bacterium]MDQ1525754.1 biotin transport system substrate-specific component [Microbacteriaceae bacterium]MDQ1606851.1 biotin transport system substrate-specific component [Microbacteriaceae bacterium]
MSTLSLAIGRPTIADRVFARGIAMDAVLVLAGAALTAIAAQVSVPLWPVPITGQTLAVLLVGSSLGALRGTLSMVLYAVLGTIGLPIFSDGSHGFGVIAGPTGGYIIGFIFAAALTGWLAQRAWDHRILGAILSFVAGSLVTFAIGLPWLAFTLGLNLEQTLAGGLYPFILGGVIKALLAAGIIRLAWHSINSSDARRDENLQ